MNMQIPSGLQALMQASQILQQEAAQTAPGPQGPQPTVASQVQQAASQVPNVQQVGQQAGIAGQLMAQRQQQAQNPQAVAQMAAQMLRQQGVASLPANMQFRDGGIIGYAGPEGSVVVGPVADRRLAKMGGRATSEEVDLMTVDEFREYERTGEIPDRVRYQLFLKRQEQVPVSPEEFSPPRVSEGLPQVLQQSAAQQRAQLGGPATAAQIERMNPEEFRSYEESGRLPARRASQPDVTPEAFTQIQPADELARLPQTPERPSPPTRAGIAQALPALAPVQAQTPQVPAYPTPQEDPELAKMRREIGAAGERLLAARRGQADLESEGIASLRKSEEERKRLLESKRSRDSFNSFIALVRDLRLRNNEYGAYMASVEARDEADRLASLANDQAILKLKQAKQAREMGDIELERQLKGDAYKLYADSRKRLDDVAKDQAQIAANLFSTQSSAANSMADRVNAVNIELARMGQQAEARKDAQEVRRLEQLRARLQALNNQLPRATDQIASALKKDPKFKGIEDIQSMASKGLELNADQKKLIQEFSRAKQDLENRILPPLEAQIQAISKELGIDVPQVPTTSTGAIDFLNLPRK